MERIVLRNKLSFLEADRPECELSSLATNYGPVSRDIVEALSELTAIHFTHLFSLLTRDVVSCLNEEVGLYEDRRLISNSLPGNLPC